MCIGFRLGYSIYSEILGLTLVDESRFNHNKSRHEGPMMINWVNKVGAQAWGDLETPNLPLYGY